MSDLTPPIALPSPLYLSQVFHDISARSIIFRNELINEFQLLDNISNHQHQFAQPPVFNTNDFGGEISKTQLSRLLR
jgi:hypothetical protein